MRNPLPAVIAMTALCALASCSKQPADSTNAPTFLPPLMGWSSWNTYHVNINEELIKEQADAMVSLGLKDAGYLYINTDDGFFGYRDSTGRMHAHPQRFPNGMKPVAEHIHALGLKAGIYSDAGHNTCGSQYDDDPNGVGAGLYGHEQQDMDLYLNEWGFDFIKIDYCGGQVLGLDEEEQYTAICQAIANTGQTDVSINICRWAFPGTWAARLARSWRISSDIQPRWPAVKHCISKNLYLSAYGGQGHYNDMDMLEVGRGLSPEEDETHFGMWCLMCSPLLIGCDLTTISDASLALLKNPELIALNQDPLSRQAYVVDREGEAYVLAKDIEQLRGHARAVAFYNATDSTHTFTIDLKKLELGGTVMVRDLVKRVNLPPADKQFTCQVSPHATLIVRMQAEKRLEPTDYEAEWAFLPDFDDLGKRPQAVAYQYSPACSGQMKVSNIGGREENYALWDEVYSTAGGKYDLTIHFTCADERDMDICINGQRHTLAGLTSHADDAIATATLPITLRPGMNAISMGNPNAPAPDIDKFTLTHAIP